MTTITHEELTFSPDSIEFRDRVQDLLSDRLQDLAIQRARGEQRIQITGDDFRQCLRAAIRQVFEELKRNR